MCYEQKQSNIMHKFYSSSEHNVQVLKMHHKTRQWMIKKHDMIEKLLLYPSIQVISAQRRLIIVIGYFVMI